jgi:RNA polymerase sigma factor (sigma-70 family)
VALSELCEAYYHPVLRFLLREGRTEDAARELAQEFFARVLAGDTLTGADQERGRFRSYLLGALKHFLADQRKHAQRRKRGGGIIVESMDGLSEPDDGPDAGPCGTRDIPAPADTSAAASFDREWALAVMARALDQLQRDFGEGERSAQFQVLKPWLMGDGSILSQVEAAGQLGTTEGAVKVMIHRLRKRFRESVRAEIAHTLRDPETVDEELRHLIEALTV